MAKDFRRTNREYQGVPTRPGWMGMAMAMAMAVGKENREGQLGMGMAMARGLLVWV